MFKKNTSSKFSYLAQFLIFQDHSLRSLELHQLIKSYLVTKKFGIFDTFITN